MAMIPPQPPLAREVAKDAAAAQINEALRRGASRDQAREERSARPSITARLRRLLRLR